MLVEFTVYGEPKGKGRPRFTRTGRCFTPKETVEYEKQVLAAWQEKAVDMFPQGTPLYIIISAYFGIPQSISKKKRAELTRKPCIKKPDADNIAKIILDALNGKAFDDDSSVCSLSVYKVYSDMPRVSIMIFDELT